MTLAFVFPIKDALVIVADRLENGKDYRVNSDDEEYRTPLNNKTKIEELPPKELIFVGAGNSELLKEFIKLINLQPNLMEFNKQFPENCTSLRSRFGNLIDGTEFILIDKKNLEGWKYFKGKIYKILGDLNNSFIGSIKALEEINLHSAKTKLLRKASLENLTEHEIDFLIGILEDLSSQRLGSIGHPAIEGCDIWEIKKGGTKKVLVEPKKYKWRFL